MNERKDSQPENILFSTEVEKEERQIKRIRTL